MNKPHEEFAARLARAMVAAGFEPKPSVLEREFNLRYWGKPMTLHGVRRWLRGEVIPSADKRTSLAHWLGMSPVELGCQPPDKPRRKRREKRFDGYDTGDVMEAFLRLSVPQRKLVREVIIALGSFSGRSVAGTQQ